MFAKLTIPAYHAAVARKSLIGNAGNDTGDGVPTSTDASAWNRLILTRGRSPRRLTAC